MDKWEQLFFGRMVASQEVSGLINFSYKGFRISHADYKQIAKEIEKGNIDIHRFVSNKARGVYNSLKDSLGLEKKTDPGQYMPATEKVDPQHSGHRMSQLGVVVHECTHAIQDSKKWQMTVGQKEIMAHAAQAVFLLGIGSALLDNNRLKAAMSLANKIRNRSDIIETDWAPLEAAIKQSYEKTSSKSRSDGIKDH